MDFAEFLASFDAGAFEARRPHLRPEERAALVPA
jgi:hypothetical protein